MKTSFKTFNPRTATNADAQNLHQFVVKTAASIENDMIKKTLALYTENLDNYVSLLSKAATIENSITSLQADKERDTVYKWAKAYAKVMSNHFDASIREIATPIYTLFMKHPDATRARIGAESSIIKNLVSDLKTLDPANLEKVGFTGWLNELDSKQAAFDQVVASQSESESSKEVGAVKAAKEKCADCYKLLTQAMESLAAIDGAPEYIQFINQVNAFIASQHSTRGKASSGENKTAENIAAEPSTNYDAGSDDISEAEDILES